MSNNRTYFYEENLTIQVWAEDRFLEIDLEDVTTSAQVLDWILYISNKTWKSPESIDDFLNALEKACNTVLGIGANEAFCPDKHGRRVDWKNRIVERP